MNIKGGIYGGLEKEETAKIKREFTEKNLQTKISIK